MIGAVKDFLAPKTFSIVAYICAIVYCLCGTVLTSVTVALRASENGTFSCFVDANSTATYKKQVDQACFKRYDQAYNSPLPLYGFVLLSTDFTVLVSVIYSLIVRDRVNDIESRHERQTDGKAVNRGRNKKTVYVFYSYFIHLVLRGLFSITFTVLQHTYFYPNGFDFKFSCNLPPTDHVTSNISTPKNASRNLNGTLVTCENATASGKWLSGIIMSVINIIVALIVIGEVIYLLPRLTILNRGLSDDSKFVIEYLLRKQFDGEIFGETLPLTCVDIYHAASCSIDVYKKQLWNRSRDPGIIYGPNANIDDLYIDVLIHTERARHKFSKEMKRHETYDVYMKVPSKSIRLKSIRDLFYPNEDTKGKFPRSILAIGRPGIGKTVLTEKILKYYSDKIVFFFKFRWFNKLTNISLKTFLRFGTGLSEENFESIYEEIAKDPQKAILIFDGLDEYHGDPISCLDQSRIIPNDPNSGTSAMNLFIKLVLGDLLKGATVVVTSRPTADDFYSRLNFDRNVEIIGFTSDKIEEYVSRFCDNNNTSDLKTKIWNHIKSSSELLNLCYIPVNCFIVCVTLSGCLSDPRNETGALPTTLTELYQTAIDHFEKHHHRNGDRNSTAHEVLKKLQRLAFLGMESGQLVFNQTLFDEEMKKSGLLNSLSNPIFPLRTQFCFIHLTIQEFLAARHVTETLAPVEIKKFISDHVKSGKWHLVLQFIAGLLGKKIKNFDREYKDCVLAFAERFKVTHGTIVVTYHEVFIMKCLREVDDEEITKEVCETTAINDVAELYINPASYHLSTSEWAAVTFVCKHMKKLENLTLLEFAADCLPEVLGLLRKRCLNKLEMRAEAHGAVADEIDQVFIALMELNCTLDHKHTKLTSLALGINNGHCPNLIHLDLGNNSIRDEGAMVLCDTLTKGLCKLNRLDINKCELTFRCIPTLVKALQDERCQLTDLSLGNNAIGDEGVGMLFEDALTKEHCKLTELNLSKCSLTDRCIPSLCKTLQDEHCKLTKLWLRSNNFTANGWKVLRDIKNYKSCKARGLQIEEPMDQDSQEGHGTHAPESSPELQASSSQVRDAVDEKYDTDTIKTSNTSDNAHLQDETVDNVAQTDIENRSISDDRVASAEQLLILGISHETEGRSKEAIKSYEQAIQNADETDRNDIKSKAYQHLGNLFYETAEYKKAIEYYLKAREISPDLEAEGEILQKETYTNLGTVHYKSCKFDAAVKSYLKVKEISHDLGERKEEANACLMLGDTFQELKQHEEAIESYRTTLNISEELEDKEMQKVAMRRLAASYLMASICYKDCDYDKAIELRKKAIEWNEKTLDILGTEPSDHLLHEKAFTGLGIDWFNLGDTEKAMESIHEAQNVAKNTDTAPRVTNQSEPTVPPGINFTVNEQGQSVSFPAASAFFQFPAEAVKNPVPIRLSCIRHQKCKVKPKNGDVFCSSIVKMEPEGYVFNKPVTVLLSHCAAQDGAYADYYDLTVQKLGKEWEDLETEQLGKPEDLPEKTVSDFCDILEYLPLAQASITEASTLVATTRIRSEEIILVPDEMYVYPRSYGNESDLEIIFPVGAVEEECRLTVQVFPVRDMLDVSMSRNDQLIQFPVLKVSGQDKPFLEPVEVVLGHSCAAVEELDEEFFPVDKKLPFTSKHGVLLRSHTNFEGNKTWENVQDDETAVIERSRKDRLEISFCVDHFCEWCIAVKKSEDVSTEGVGHTCESHQPDVKAVCVAPYETDSRSERKLSAVVAPLNKSKEVKTVWGLPGEILLLKNMVEIFYCVPLDDGDHLQLQDNNIQFYQDAINIRYNRVKCDESALDGLDMRFLRTECVDNKHFGTACLGKCPITPKQGTHMGETSGTSESPTTISCLQTSKSGHLTSSNGESNADDQITKTLKVMKERCEFFQKEMERFYKKRLKFDKKESKASKVVSVVGPMTSVLIGIGGGLVIAMSVPTLGIVTAFTGAAVAAVTLTVKIKDYHSNTKTASNVKELRSDCNVTERHVGQLKNDPLSVILTILKEVGIELSRIFEEQLFKLHDNKDVTEMASCAVNLMFKFKDSAKFDRNTLLRNVLRGEAKTNPKLKTKRNNKRWEARDVFQNPGLRKEIPTSVSSSSFVEFEYLSKANDTCDPQTYGYRGEILEMICKTTNNESEARNIGCTEPDGGAYDTTSSCCPVDTNGARGEVTYFVECDIDKEYTETCAEANYYQPFHCLVRCPSILESFASEEGNLSRPSLRNVVSKMYHPRVRPVRPVYRPHSRRILRSLSNTDLSDSDFSRVNFSSSRLENCDLTGCTILFGELEGASLCRSQFKETYLSHCNLTGVNAQSCTWTTTKVHHSCADYADLRGGDNIVGGNSWEGTSLENVKIKGEPSLPTVTNQPEPTVPPGINADEEQGNGIATVSPMLDTSSANNNPLPRPIEDTPPSVPRVTNQTKQAGINADEEQGNGIAIVLPTLDTSSANNNYLKMTIYPDKYRGQSWV